MYKIEKEAAIVGASTDFCVCRERVELENLKGEHARLLEEAKKEKVLFVP